MSDLISRQAAIAEFSCCELTPDGGIDVNYAIDFLEQMPSAQQWIPVSERLPEDTRTVLTTFIEDGVAKVDTLNYFGEPLGWTDFRYDEELDRPKSYEVTAWMPLPKPWRGEEDEAD